MSVSMLATQLSFSMLIHSRTEAQGLALPTVCWVLLHQLTHTRQLSRDVCTSSLDLDSHSRRISSQVGLDCVNLTVKTHHNSFAINTSD